MQKYYIDACIWRDYFENRSDNLRPLGDWAFRFIKKVVDEGGLFLISDMLLVELRKFYTDKQIVSMFEIVPPELRVNISTSEKQTEDALKMKNQLKIPSGDAFHAVLAKDNDALMISRDAHFYGVMGIVVKKPEELI